jgi:hypothetical protein
MTGVNNNNNPLSSLPTTSKSEQRDPRGHLPSTTTNGVCLNLDLPAHHHLPHDSLSFNSFTDSFTPTIASPLESFVIPSPTNGTATARKSQQPPTTPSACGEHRHRSRDATNIESNARRKSRSRKPRIRKPGSPWLHRKTKDAAGSLARTTASQRTGSSRPPCCAGGCCRDYCTKSF